MPEGDVIDNAALMKALTDVNKGFEALKADVDAMKRPRGRTSHDVIDRERNDRINNDVGRAQDVLDNARRASANADRALERIRSARVERHPAAAGLPGGQPLADRGRNPILNHLTGKALTADQIQARGDYREKFLAYLRDGDKGDVIRLAPKAAMQTQIGEKGGFLVPFEMENTVIQLSRVYSAMRSICDVRSITRGNSVKQPANMQGSTFGWTGETETKADTETDDIAMLEWFLMTAYALPETTNDLLADADFDVEAWLNEGIAREFAEGEGAAFISGTGVKQPRGIQSYSTVADASWVWGKIGFIVSGVAAAITDSTHNGFDAMIDVLTSLKREYLPNARWLSNRVTQGVLRKVKDANDNYIWQPAVALDRPATILGYPTETDDNIPNEGANLFPLMFGDFSQAYRIVDKPGMMMLRDELTKKGWTKFYTTKRVGAGVKNFEAVKFLKCST
jgi:HK97 family phage major capsid protein